MHMTYFKIQPEQVTDEILDMINRREAFVYNRNGIQEIVVPGNTPIEYLKEIKHI